MLMFPLRCVPCTLVMMEGAVCGLAWPSVLGTSRMGSGRSFFHQERQGQRLTSSLAWLGVNSCSVEGGGRAGGRNYFTALSSSSSSSSSPSSGISSISSSLEDISADMVHVLNKINSESRSQGGVARGEGDGNGDGTSSSGGNFRISSLRRHQSVLSAVESSYARQVESDASVSPSVLAEYSEARRRLELVEGWLSFVMDCATLIEMSSKGEDVSLFIEETESELASVRDQVERLYVTSLYRGKYDGTDQVSFVITAGAGGTEACDWVAMLFRMYEMYFQKKGWRVTNVVKSAGDVVGYKSVEFQVQGGQEDFVYGNLRGEKGAHRLVRVSPFNSKGKRITTFAGVDVTPVLQVQDLENELKDVEGDCDVSFSEYCPLLFSIHCASHFAFYPNLFSSLPFPSHLTWHQPPSFSSFLSFFLVFRS